MFRIVKFCGAEGSCKDEQSENGIAERHAVGARKRNGEGGGARARNK